MKAKSAPTVSQTIRITVEGKTYELSKAEAKKLYEGLEDALNIQKPVVWPTPVVIERHVPREPWRPYWDQTWCDAAVQATTDRGNDILNLITH